MTIGPWRDGWRRVFAAPLVVAGMFVMTLLAALPLALTIRDAIASHLGRSLVADQVADGVSWDWWQEFLSQATGVERTFTPVIIGFASTLDGIGSVLDASAIDPPIVAALAVYLGAWIFLSGGVLDRYARQRPTRAHGFFAASGVFFWRFLRLGVVAAVTYWFLFAYVHRWLFDTWYVNATRDLDVERTAFAWRVGMYALFGLLLVAANVVFDFAKVRLVVEDRRSAIGALAASLTFIARNGRAVAGLYAVNGISFLLLIAGWRFAAPAVGRAGGLMWLGVLLTQLYIVARLLLKLQFLASETALFQSRLAHARYTGVPEPAWPDSPAADTIVSVRLPEPSVPSAASSAGPAAS
jgi:hypothetical protein